VSKETYYSVKRDLLQCQKSARVSVLLHLLYKVTESYLCVTKKKDQVLIQRPMTPES
jgi:hypothetical protein